MGSMLVTGGMGFIGSNFILRMLEERPSVRIVNLDALTYAGHPGNLVSVRSHPRYRFVRGSITDAELVGRIMEEEDIEVVVHFAAESHVDRSILRPREFVDTNVGGTFVLLEAARQRGVRKFVHISTDEVYGSIEGTGKFTEDSPIRPNSPYSASKAASDLLVRAWFRTYRMPVVITRCSNNYGPRQFPEKMIPNFILRALRDEPLPVYGDGLHVRDWLHVDDHCRAIAAVVDRGVPGEVYNVGGHGEMANIEVARLILRELGKPESLIDHVADRPGHDRRYAIDAGKISRTLGWKPTVPFPEGLSATVRWYLENEEWWKAILTGEYRNAGV